MNFNEFNLNQLLELGLRFPEIGAVNFNVLYVILKTIIKKQGLETLTPAFAFTQEILLDSTEDGKDIDSKSSDKHNIEEIFQNLKGFAGFEEEICKLTEVVEKLSTKVSDLEARPVQPNVISPESKSEETKGSEDESPTESEETVKTSSDDKERFARHNDEILKLKLNSLKHEFESLKDKETELEQLFNKMQSLQASTDYIVDRFDELTQDFNTVMNGYSKLGLQVEELDEEVNKKIKIEDDVEKLREHIDKLETYVYVGKYTPVEKETQEKILPVEEESLEPKHYPRYMIGKAEVQQKAKDKKAQFARVVNDLMTLPEERKGDVVDMSDTESEVKRTTMRKHFREFIKIAMETRKMKELPKDKVHEVEAIEVKETEEETKAKDIVEEAKAIPISKLQQEVELDASELVVEESSENMFPGTAKKKLLKALKAITLTKGMQQTQHAARVVKAQKKEVLQPDLDAEEEEIQASTEIFEIREPPSDHVSEEHIESKPPEKLTILSTDDSKFQELREQIVLYVKSRLEEIESAFMDKIKKVETSIIGVEEENLYWRDQILELTGRLVTIEKNQSDSEERLTILEKKVKANYVCIQDMITELDKKADTSDNFGGMNRKDMSSLEDRMLQINETTSVEIEDLRSFLKEYVLKLRGELDEKMSGFDVDLRLERIAGRLKVLEKVLKEVSVKVRFLECQSMGPIEIKRYLHCEDGRRIKPIQKAMGHWTSATRSDLSTVFDNDKLFEENIADQIEADVQQRLEDVIIRESKRYISGAHTKMKSTRI